MRLARRAAKPVSVFTAFFWLLISGPYQSALAAMIDTEAVLDIDRAQSARIYLETLISRQDIREILVSRGIDPEEARARINSLSDSEVNAIADKVEQLPAGGIFEILLVAALLVFLILLFTDIAGHTDVFSFVKKSSVRDSSRTDTASKTIESKLIQNLLIHFEQDSNELSDKAIAKLNQAYDTMVKNPEAKLAIYGSQDSKKSQSYDKMLSENRVYTVKMYLVGKGLNPQRTKTVLDSPRVKPPVNSVEVKIEVKAEK